jgi:tetratricopeptide (TPR) repeat protein
MWSVAVKDSSIREILRRTDGWLELGCPKEALVQLDELPDSLHATREVLKLKCRAFHMAEDWTELKVLAATCVMNFQMEPAFKEEWAWAEHKLGNTREAYSILSQSFERFQWTWRTAYYLACFSYCLKRVGEATEWLGRALLIHPKPAELKRVAINELAFQA